MGKLKKTATISFLKGHNRDGISVRTEDGTSIGVFRGKKYNKDKVVAFDSYGNRRDKYVSREEGDRILAGITGSAMGKLTGTDFQHKLPAKKQHKLTYKRKRKRQ